MLILSLVYIGIVLLIAGTVIFFVRFLVQIRSQSRNYHILSVLGADNEMLVGVLRKEVLLNFIILLLPTLALSIGVVYGTGYIVIKQYFMVPVFESILLPAAEVFCVGIVAYLVIYIIYGFLSYKIAKREIYTDNPWKWI